MFPDLTDDDIKELSLTLGGKKVVVKTLATIKVVVI